MMVAGMRGVVMSLSPDGFGVALYTRQWGETPRSDLGVRKGRRREGSDPCCTVIRWREFRDERLFALTRAPSRVGSARFATGEAESDPNRGSPWAFSPTASTASSPPRPSP